MTLEETLDELKKHAVRIELIYAIWWNGFEPMWLCDCKDIDDKSEINTGNTPLEAATKCLKRYKENVK